MGWLDVLGGYALLLGALLFATMVAILPLLIVEKILSRGEKDEGKDHTSRRNRH